MSDRECRKCGTDVEFAPYRSCRACRRSAWRRRRQTQHPEAAAKAKTRAQSRTLPTQPCLLCGKQAERHHIDYAQPLLVLWFCREHHAEAHRYGPEPAPPIVKVETVPLKPVVTMADLARKYGGAANDV